MFFRNKKSTQWTYLTMGNTLLLAVRTSQSVSTTLSGEKRSTPTTASDTEWTLSSSPTTTSASLLQASVTTTVSHGIYPNSKYLERIMYWSLHDNNILCSFIGHSDSITQIDLNPADSTFVSCAKDNTTRVWEYEKKQCKVYGMDGSYFV